MCMSHCAYICNITQQIALPQDVSVITYERYDTSISSTEGCEQIANMVMSICLSTSTGQEEKGTFSQ